MITSISNPRVRQVIQWQEKAKERHRDKVFVVEGTKMFLETPDQLIREVYLSEDFRMDGPDDKLLRTGYETVSGHVFAKMSDTQSPQGILAVVGQPRYDLDQLLNTPNPLFLILEDLQDPGNLGTIVRTGEGAGITGIIMSSHTVDIFNPKVIRATMGSIYRVPFLYESDLSQTLRKLHDAGVKSYAAHLKGESCYDGFSFQGPTAFLIGNEGKGLSDELSKEASSYLKIPMEGKLESLNASVAAALLMYEAHRQRAGGGAGI